MINLDAVLHHHFLKLTVADRIGYIPANRPQDDVPLKMTALRKAPQLVDALRTPEDALIPPNTLAEIRRDLARLAILREQIKEIEQARLKHLEDAPQSAPNAMVQLLASVIGLGIETAYLLVL